VGRLFNRLDTAYQHTSDLYGFVCNGCDDNCCRSLFYHHTLAEYAYLYAGFSELPNGLRRELIVKSRQAGSMHGRNEQRPKRAFCPLNEKGRCMVYRYRPMICRLHGLPHELHYPGKPAQHGPGCDAFSALCSNIPYIPFDRTPFYAEMAALEQTLRRATGFTARLRLTVAEMVVAFAAE
jgi:Fe-S-cluster containining protein